MLPIRSFVQTTKTLNPDDEKIYSTYQDDYSNGENHGNLVKHYGNGAYLDKETHNYSRKNLKPFLTPAFQNLTSQYFMSNRFTDSYSNNYKTSNDNVLKRPLRTAPVKSKLDHLFQIKTTPVAKDDEATIYEQEYLNKRVNDHFVSNKIIKTETISLRDTIACLMELADHMRNKSYDVNSRNLFGKDEASQLNHLDHSGQLFSKLIILSESLLCSYNKVNLSANELKKMFENFKYAENIIDRNLWDRALRPDFERTNYAETENSIRKDRIVFTENKDKAKKLLNEAHILLNEIENYVHFNLEEIIEEAKVLLMFKLCKSNYEKQYLRDSNGYIKRDAKLPMSIQAWFDLANKGIEKSDILKSKAENMNSRLIESINKIGNDISAQWMETHQISSNQVEYALKTQSRLIDTQYDLKKELDQLNQSINDASSKMRTCQMFNEVCLTQLEAPIAKIDPFYNENRKRQLDRSNQIWANAYELRDNLNNMLEYRKDLTDRSVRLSKNIYSNHLGVNYDLNKIVGPRRFTAGAHPSTQLVAKSIHF